MSAYHDWLSLREIDTRNGQAKGSAFRAFKRLEAGLLEGRDYVLLDHAQAATQIAALKQAQRAYQSSVNLLLLHPAVAERLLDPPAGRSGN